MPYLGSTPNASFSSRTKQDFTANGSTTAFTLSSAVASANDIEVFVGNVRQEPTDAYTVNGTTLTMSAAPSNGINFYVVFKGLEENSIVPADNTISSAKIASGAVTDAKIASSAVTDAKIAGMAATKLTGTVSNARFPVGCVVQTLQSKFNPSHEATTSTSYQASAMHMTIEKHFATSKVLVTMAQGHQYVNAYANGCLSTICQEGSSSTLTASTSYNSSNDPTTAVNFGMQQVYNSTTLNTAPHSKNYLFDSTGSKFEAFRNFYRSRTAGRNAQFHEYGHQLTMTLMEIKQ